MSLIHERLNALAWLLVCVVFAAEVTLDDGANLNLLYVVVLLLGLWTPRTWDVLHMAGLATALSAVAYAASPEAWDPSVAMWNRTIEIVVLWITAFGVNLHRRTLLQREHAERHARDADARLRKQAALAEIGKMATLVAHEVRNPLAGIRGAMQIIGRRLDPGGREHAIALDVVTRVDRLNAQLTELLNFSKSNGSPDGWWNRTGSQKEFEALQTPEER